ncbi:MAG: hypothetical protein ACLFVO_17130 [Chloroflexaceae bacterium]
MRLADLSTVAQRIRPVPLRCGIVRLFLFCGLLALLLPLHRVAANAAPPPDLIWFRFVDSAASSPREGVQLLRCNDAVCEQPELLQQSGVCDAPACLSGSIETTEQSPLACRADRCMYVYGYGGFNQVDYLRLIVQYPDQVRQSNVFPSVEEASYQHETAFRVAMTNGSLQVEPDPQAPARPRAPIIAFGVTLAVELVVAALVLLRLGVARREVGILLLMITLINLLSFPVVWIFFPALGFFQEESERVFGTYMLVLALGYGGVVGGIRWVDNQRRRWLLGVGALLSVPLLLLCIGPIVVLNFTSYSPTPPLADGLPYGVTLTLSELFAFGFETLLIYLVSRRRLNIGQAALLSLLMNAASFLAGLLLQWLLTGRVFFG